MKVTIVEGTPDEIRRAFPGLGQETAPIALVQSSTESASEAPEDAQGNEANTGDSFVSLEVARAFLSRRPLSAKQLTVLKLIYDAGNERVLATTLQEAVDYSNRQLAGLMGAFGRRIANTDGYADEWLFDHEWDYDAECYGYRLPETMREAMRLEKLA